MQVYNVNMVIIPVGGNGSRWKNFRGTQKYLTKVENQVLINRTVEQFNSNKIIIVSNDDISFHLDIEKPRTGQWNDAAKLWSSAHLWSDTERTIVAFGDVWFSDEAVKTILENKDPIQFFMRPGPSKITGKNYKEIFAISFTAENKSYVYSVLEQVILENKPGPGTYLLYKKINNLENIPAKYHFDKKYFVEINDWTEDFDHPEDLTKWEQRRKKLSS
jgi:hypothetical protein